MDLDLDQGREAFGRRAWGDAYAGLSAADRESPLDVEDLERLAVAAHLVGEDEESSEVWGRAYRVCVDRGDVGRAARCSFWSGFGLITRGGIAQAGGWFARARRALRAYEQDCVEHGYVLAADAIEGFFSGDSGAARGLYEELIKVGERFGDADLLTLGQLGRGQILIELGDVAEGTAGLDEAMVAVTDDLVSPVLAGLVYCAVIDSCQQAFDVRRAREWTGALSRWCAAQPDLVPYRGQCLVHRSEIMLMQGSWDDAVAEVELACQRLAGEPAVGSAYYQQAELHRLAGEFTEAEDGYRRANRWGRPPYPGLALLWLAQGRAEAAEAAVRGALDDTHDPAGRPKLLAAQVEVCLALGDVATARAAADDLSGFAGAMDSPFLDAVAASADGATLMAEGDPRTALSRLRSAWRAWHDLEAPYEAACVRVLVAQACQQLGDENTADMELDAARWVYEQLGAAPDLARVEALAAAARPDDPGGLTARELEVLRLVATGRTNRQIAEELVISDKTVARHLSNIFTKLAVSSRAAATAYAYEHGWATPQSGRKRWT